MKSRSELEAEALKEGLTRLVVESNGELTDAISVHRKTPDLAKAGAAIQKSHELYQIAKENGIEIIGKREYTIDFERFCELAGGYRI